MRDIELEDAKQLGHDRYFLPFEGNDLTVFAECFPADREVGLGEEWAVYHVYDVVTPITQWLSDSHIERIACALSERFPGGSGCQKYVGGRYVPLTKDEAMQKDARI